MIHQCGIACLGVPCDNYVLVWHRVNQLPKEGSAWPNNLSCMVMISEQALELMLGCVTPI